MSKYLNARLIFIFSIFILAGTILITCGAVILGINGSYKEYGETTAIVKSQRSFISNREYTKYSIFVNYNVDGVLYEDIQFTSDEPMTIEIILK